MRSNKYAGLCAVCGIVVAIGLGRYVGASGARRILCRTCPPRPPRPGHHDGWHRVPLASLDLETTGVDPLTDRVLSFALLGDHGVDLAGLVNPGVPIPPGSAAVHGLTAETLVDAPPSEVGLAVVLDWVQDLVDRRVGLVVFNATYDLTMLRAEAARTGLVQPDWDRLLVVDPYVIDWGIERGGLGPRRLTDVSAYYRVPLANAHDATADARAARQVAYEIGRRHPAVAAHSLDGLMQRQREWYAARAESWNAYARTVGRNLDDPHGWPLSAVPAA